MTVTERAASRLEPPRPAASVPTFSWRWILAYVIAAAAGLGAYFFVRVNRTPSLPTGVYALAPVGRTPPAPGDDVFVCLPPGPEAALALERGYVEPSRRDCLSGAVPLLKHVLATAGDTVTVARSGVRIGSTAVGNAPPLHDGMGRPMRPAFGRHVLGPGTLWLGSDIDNGFDSRYLGPLADSLVIGRAHLLVRF